ncbi:MAG: S8/S53 family peptidase [Planctomycetes bacterium]|nr:S8/S53 family peptidase [Planctomycetota bacterium]
MKKTKGVLTGFGVLAVGLLLLFNNPFIQAKGTSSQDVAGKAAEAGSNLITFSKIDKAWEYAKGNNVKVAVLDWLFDMSPKASKKYEHATSMVPGQPIGFTEAWHGEWMAQIVHDIAPKAKIIPIRARPLSKEGDRDSDGRQVYEKYLIKGIRYAADHGAVAVTNSMGPVKHCDELRAAIDYAEQKGTIFINVHPEYLIYTKEQFKQCDPNQCDKRIIHAGIVPVPKHPNARVNPCRDIYVWPYQINPTFRDGWGFSNGPPIVAGVIALMKSANSELTPRDIRKIISETAFIKDGFKVLDAEAAVRQAIALKQ